MNTDPLHYKIVRLANGTFSIHSLAEQETFHPVIGPVEEAQALYISQLKLRQRLQHHDGEFVIWDVGLGGGGNVFTLLRATRDLAGCLRVVSFDRTKDALQFALQHASDLGYVGLYADPARALLEDGSASFINERQSVRWELRLGDFPDWLAHVAADADARPPAPHAILFDAFSPAKNPAMWTAPLFAGLFGLLDPDRPCAMPTYSRSTMLRVTLLLAGFHVGVGRATGEKEETTIAANTPDLIDEPLPRAWLQRAHRSRSAEPMWEPHYRQAPLTPDTWARLQAHPQFACQS